MYVTYYETYSSTACIDMCVIPDLQQVHECPHIQAATASGWV
jgi:hypothetical protein